MPASNKRFKLTRIAPTPSGFLHLGNAYSFALSAAIAETTGAEILLRVDDLDRDRVDLAYVNDIFDTLSFLNIPWQRGPFNVQEYKSRWSQFCRIDIYQPALQQLAADNNVFACTCSRKQLQTQGYECRCASAAMPLDTPSAAWRVLTDERLLKINTLTNGIVNASLGPDMKNFIVRKKDGLPAYQLTSLIDDIYFGVDMIIRGEDLWPSTVAQCFLTSLLNIEQFAQTTFHHHPLLLTNDDIKLSKSAGATSIQYLRHQGLPPFKIYQQIGNALKPQQELHNWRDLLQNF